MDDVHRSLIEASPDGILAADRNGTIQLWNAGAERIFGYTATEAVGQSLDLIVPERQRTRHWDGYRKVFETGETQYGSRLLAVPAIRKDSKRISIEFSVALLRDEAGDVAAIAAIVRDVTERWKRERARAQSVNERND